jgi:hypothetical protein
VDVAGGVQLTITSALMGTENLQAKKALYLNVSNSIDPTKLSFSLTGNTNFAQASKVELGRDKFKAGPVGMYDILFTYAPSTKVFTSGESQTYLIAYGGTGGISASYFDLMSSSTSGGGGGWLAAVHVQNTRVGGEDSAWVGATTTVPKVPDGGMTLMLLGGALVGLEILRRKFRA